MMYNLHELGRAAVTPYRLAAEAHVGLLRHPYNPLSYTPAWRVVSAALDVFEHTTRPYGKPDFNLPTTTIDGRTVAVTEEVVERRPFGQLRHFIREGASPNDPRVLVVAPHSGHYATLLRGTVEALLPGHDVYITEWRDGRMAPLAEGAFSLDNYIDYVIAFLHYLGQGTHVLAVCQPAQCHTKDQQHPVQYSLAEPAHQLSRLLNGLLITQSIGRQGETSKGI